MANFTFTITFELYIYTMCVVSYLSLFIGNIRGWQLIIILFAICLLLLVPALFGFVLGRKSAMKHQSRRRR